MTEISQTLLTWTPYFIQAIVLCFIFALLVLFGFWMGRATQDMNVSIHKRPVKPKPMPPPLDDGDIFRKAMAGDDKDERISTLKK